MILKVFTLMFGLYAHAGLKLNISIVYKKGVSKELVLTSEMHSSEMVENNEQVTVTMSNGLQYRFRAFFVDTHYEYGPSSILNIHGEIIGQNNKYTKPLLEVDESGRQVKGQLLTPLGEGKYFVFDDPQGGQRVEITVRPLMAR